MKNTTAMRVIFFSKIFKIESIFAKCNKKLGECFVFSEIISPENVAINGLD